MAMFNAMLPVLLGVGLWLKFGARQVAAFDMSSNTNLAVYWGQDSYGLYNSDQADWQQPISYYCQDDVIDIIPVAFVDVFFDTGGYPDLNLANTCGALDDNPVFSGTSLANCSFLASDIEFCQNAGKIVTISLGGSTGGAIFSSDSQAESFAQQIWDLFLGGESDFRPFGSVVLDGVDLDIEGGSSTGFASFVSSIRALMDADTSKQYYVTGAPQCPYPDAYLGPALESVAFDAVFVQFYNNYCGLPYFDDSNDWNFATWDNWAKTVSVNPDVKVYIGAPASSTAANEGYVDASTLTTIIQDTLSQYSSFGGVMLWDASQAYANDRFDISAKDALLGGSYIPTSGGSTSASQTSTSQAATTSPASTSSGCNGVAAWNSQTAYVGGDEVTYDGDLWTAAWWTEDDAPGGAAGVWTNDGPCTDSDAVLISRAVATEAPVARKANPARVVPAEHWAVVSRPTPASDSISDVDEKRNSRFFRFM